MLNFLRNVYHFLKKIKNRLCDRAKQYISLRGEERKFKDSRRVAIWSAVNLSKEQQNAIDEFYISNYRKKFLMFGIVIILRLRGILM